MVVSKLYQAVMQNSANIPVLFVYAVLSQSRKQKNIRCTLPERKQHIEFSLTKANWLPYITSESVDGTRQYISARLLIKIHYE